MLTQICFSLKMLAPCARGTRRHEDLHLRNLFPPVQAKGPSQETCGNCPRKGKQLQLEHKLKKLSSKSSVFC